MTNMKMTSIIPKSGSWVFVTQNITTTDTPVAFGSIFYALPVRGSVRFEVDQYPFSQAHIAIQELNYEIVREKYRQRDLFKLAHEYHFWLANGNRGNRFHESEVALFARYQQIGVEVVQNVKVLTEWGEVVLKPHEYNRLTNERLQCYLEEIRDNQQGRLVFLHHGQNLQGKLADRLFYLRSRGISYLDALMMLVDLVKSRNLFYIEMHPAVVQMFTHDALRLFARKLSAYYDSGMESQAQAYLTLLRQCTDAQALAVLTDTQTIEV